MNAGPMDPLSTGLLVVLMVASFYLLIIRPNRRRQAEQAKLTEALKPGVRVMLSSGIYGTVVGVGEKQATVQVAPGIELTVIKQAVLHAITPGSQYAEDESTAAVDAPHSADPNPDAAGPTDAPASLDFRELNAGSTDPAADEAQSGHPGEGEKR